ncbi:MAG TPA: bifunctional YncE family protein/alkaline phosphatase family protein, partial [Candidatus Cybelea sp.]|nr:bifunctional YncE family protein/alkaline phosphatase family protein [Candidatus Cybelea sp.]
PAGTQPSGPDKIHPANAVLPNGRIAAPAGATLFVGSNPLGLALSPDGRYAVVSNDAPAPNSSLTVVDTKSMRVVDEYRSPSASFFMGVAVARDPAEPSRTLVLASDVSIGAVRVFDLGPAGELSLDGQAIQLPRGTGVRAFPAMIALAPDTRTAYVADNLGNVVDELDLASRSVARSLAVGDFPLYVAAGNRAVVAAGTGLSSYAATVPPAQEPRFTQPAFDPEKSSALTVFEASGAQIGDPATVHMDPAPDGTQIVGGAAPGAMVVSRNGKQAYVALGNVDRVAVVALSGEPRVVRGLDLRLYPGAPYGAEPSAEALGADGKRLYVALAGLNAVAVLDANRPARYRYGLIPTAWYPTALALSRDGRYLYILGSKGVNGWGVLQRVDLKRTYLVRATLDALRYNRTPAVAKFDPVIPPLRSNKRSEAVDHVVYVATGPLSYDAIFGNLTDTSGNPHGNGDASLDVYPESAAPNLHALAKSYALADNFYASDANPDIAKEFAAAGEATLYQQLVAAAGAARAPLDDHGDNPEDYGRDGYLFNALARAGISFRDYGGLLRLSGYDGTHYTLDVPALAALSGNVDLSYSNPALTEEQRADEFVRDMQRYVESDSMPSFTYISLRGQSGKLSAAAADHALGKIVDYISHTPHWSSTAIFIVPDGAGSNDHVNALRTFALVVSPLARRGYVGETHLSMAGVLKTEEEIFGLPPLTLNDLLASDLSAFFTDAPAPEPYQAR